MANSKFKDLYAPTIVLVAIAFFITLALVFANDITKPTIEKINKKNADATRAQVLPSGKDAGFEEYKGKLTENVDEVYMAKDGSGVVITSHSKSFGGTLTAMVGINKDGKINDVAITDHKDTPGLGTKAFDPNYTKVYKGKSKFDKANIKDQKDMTYIVGASVSSNGLFSAVKAALTQYEATGGVK
ncbi:MAG: FMN-binding protein [Eubacteriales bacterium]|nr:FMN-binding protein [Eubacteriales bacterium]MDY3332293.1 FMN-binding protein [Gallibacter sp.]